MTATAPPPPPGRSGVYRPSEAQPARVEAAVRLLLESGDITPQGARVIRLILESAS